MGGRPPEPWRQWLLSMEPEVRARWLDTFRRAKPALRARMIEQFFDRIHGTPTRTVEVTNTGGPMEIVLKHVEGPR